MHRVLHTCLHLLSAWCGVVRCAGKRSNDYDKARELHLQNVLRAAQLSSNILRLGLRAANPDSL